MDETILHRAPRPPLFRADNFPSCHSPWPPSVSLVGRVIKFSSIVQEVKLVRELLFSEGTLANRAAHSDLSANE